MKSVEKQYAEEKGMLRTSISKQKTAVETDLSALKNLLTNRERIANVSFRKHLCLTSAMSSAISAAMTAMSSVHPEEKKENLRESPVSNDS